jgi:hypothetical protein
VSSLKEKSKLKFQEGSLAGFKEKAAHICEI